MPTAIGQETVGERLTRLRAELARVRSTIARSENNGSAFSLGGTQVTQIGYERAQQRERRLQREITHLEARLLRSPAPGVAQFQSKGTD